ncbi:MAG: hypothetical protein AAGL89_01850 [Pseudomonadota bacterium]
MPLRPIALIAALAPLQAAAFGDMDCVVTEACNGATCTDTTDFYEVTFDWAAETATILRSDQVATLTMRPAPPISDGDDISAALEYSRDAAHGITFFRVEASAGDITALMLESGPAPISSLAVCERKQAI